MKRKEILVLLLISLMLTLIASCAPPVTPDVTDIVRYVATDGDDTNDGSEEFPWRTIQYALTNIPKSGTILVKDGVYNESIRFPSTKKIILQSVNGDSSTTIIGYISLSTVTCSNSLPGTTLKGFTITHNSGDTGRGIDISGGCLNINNCTISNNSVAAYGGGIYNKSLLTITSSTISYNSAYVGGGIYNCGALTINRSTIINNYATEGGGIYNCGTLTITEESTISYNYVDQDGGGIRNYGTLTINSGTISYNYACHGGGICNNWWGFPLTITSSTISYNYVDMNGGGIYFDLGLETANIGSSGEENTICGNYKTGEPPSLDQQIMGNYGSLYDTYEGTNFISAYCTQ